MATTPNYSWPTPDNTDLVRDGAEAMRDLGNAIDNTVYNLPPSPPSNITLGKTVVGSEKYTIPGYHWTTLSGSTPANDSVRAFGISVSQDTTYANVAAEVTTSDSGFLVRFGLFEVGANGLPNDLVEDYGVIDGSSTGIKTLTGPFTVPQGVYWVCWAVTKPGAGALRIPGTQTFGPVSGFGRATINEANSQGGLLKTTGGNTIVSNGFGNLTDSFFTATDIIRPTMFYELGAV
jgi:hypothetical protein